MWADAYLSIYIYTRCTYLYNMYTYIYHIFAHSLIHALTSGTSISPCNILVLVVLVVHIVVRPFVFQMDMCLCTCIHVGSNVTCMH